MLRDETIQRVLKFRDDRNWRQFHTPKDLAISMSLERVSLGAHAMCGVITHPGIPKSGQLLSIGSFKRTSVPYPAMVLDSRASRMSASSTRPPRAVFIIMAVFFMRERFFLLMIFSVSFVSGV